VVQAFALYAAPHPGGARHPASGAGRKCCPVGSGDRQEACMPPQAHTTRARGVEGGDGKGAQKKHNMKT